MRELKEKLAVLAVALALLAGLSAVTY